MQNVVNYLVPFFKDGSPIVNGRVKFVVPSTDSEYIPIYSFDGTPLQNPLPLNSEGSFEVQPFVNDNTDFSMIIEAPTGFPPQIINGTLINTMEYQKVRTINVKGNKTSEEESGIAVVGNLDELRELDPSKSNSVLVMGYHDATDFCPPRVFYYSKSGAGTDNGGTYIKPNKYTGSWILKYNDVLDIRWFGNLYGMSNHDNLIERAISGAEHGSTIYFPQAHYSFESSKNFYPKELKVSLANGVIFSNESYTPIVFRIHTLLCDNQIHFESISHPLILDLREGVFRSSWFNEYYDEIYDPDNINSCETIVLDESLINLNPSPVQKIVENLIANPNKITRIVYPRKSSQGNSFATRIVDYFVTGRANINGTLEAESITSTGNIRSSADISAQGKLTTPLVETTEVHSTDNKNPLTINIDNTTYIGRNLLPYLKINGGPNELLDISYNMAENDNYARFDAIVNANDLRINGESVVDIIAHSWTISTSLFDDPSSGSAVFVEALLPYPTRAGYTLKIIVSGNNTLTSSDFLITKNGQSGETINVQKDGSSYVAEVNGAEALERLYIKYLGLSYIMVTATHRFIS